MSIQHKSKNLEEITSFLSASLAGKKAVVGISGGIDSATVLMLLSKILDSDSIIAVFMPDEGTPEADYSDIKELSRVSGVRIDTVSIQPMVEAFTATLKASDPKPIGNIKSRVRMITLYYHSNVNNALVVGTTNKSENLIGYFTKYGDGGCDIEPIIDLYKWEVRELAKELNVPIAIREKKPSAGLWAGQYDENEMGMSYEELDSILADLFEYGKGQISEKHTRVYRMYLNSEHKRRMPLKMDN